MSLDRSTPPPRGGRRQRIDEIVDELPADDVETLRFWLGDLRFSPEFIRRELSREGIGISVGAICGYRKRVLKIGDRKK